MPGTHDYSDAARASLATDLDVIAGKCDWEAQRAEANAAHHLEQHQAARDDAQARHTKAALAHDIAAGLRHHAQPLPIEQRSDLLVKLAQQRNEHAVDDDTVAAFLTAWSPARGWQRLEFLFDDLREHVKTRDDLGADRLDAATAFGFTGMDAKDRALQHANTLIDDALQPLLHGEHTNNAQRVAS